VNELARLQITPGIFWSGLSFPIEGGTVDSLDGIPNAAAKEMALAIAQAIRRVRIAELIKNFDEAMQPVTAWALSASGACVGQLTTKGWLQMESVSRLGRDS
jgi:hypothetical protein